MSSFPMEVGRVVFSKAGRDAGHYFVVVAVLDEDHVAIANGCQRKVDNPKKKKIKHLRPKPIVVNVDGATLPNKHLQDSDLRTALAAHGLEIENAPAIAGENEKVGVMPTKEED